MVSLIYIVDLVLWSALYIIIIANILDESLRMNLDNWSCCNEFVKAYSADPSPVSSSLANAGATAIFSGA